MDPVLQWCGAAPAVYPSRAPGRGFPHQPLHKAGGLRGRWMWIQACRGAPVRPWTGFTIARRGVSRAARRSPGGVRTLALGGRPCAGPPGLARRRAVAADSRCGGSREGRARRSGPGVQLLWLTTQ